MRYATPREASQVLQVSEKTRLVTGTETEKYEQLELPLVIDDTTLIPSLILLATQESESSTPESVHISKSQTLNGKPTICNPCSQTENLVIANRLRTQLQAKRTFIHSGTSPVRRCQRNCGLPQRPTCQVWS